MDSMDLLLWARGPGFTAALAIFIFGLVLRLFEIYGLGRRRDLAPPRPASPGSGLRTVFSRSYIPMNKLRRAPVTVLGGYIFHLGLFIVLLLLVPHIELIRGLTGVGWPGLPTPLVDVVAVITLVSLLVLLVHRLFDPVKRLLSTPGDYFAWLLTFLPLLTGYLAYHHLLLPYTAMLALHILSAELLLIALPFTKLVHAMTLFIARWYNGELFGRKGVAS